MFGTKRAAASSAASSLKEKLLRNKARRARARHGREHDDDIDGETAAPPEPDADDDEEDGEGDDDDAWSSDESLGALADMFKTQPTNARNSFVAFLGTPTKGRGVSSAAALARSTRK